MEGLIAWNRKEVKPTTMVYPSEDRAFLDNQRRGCKWANTIYLDKQRAIVELRQSRHMEELILSKLQMSHNALNCSNFYDVLHQVECHNESPLACVVLPHLH
eukprot:scaffold214852_cov23-Tisochrysis_lutea.AAC.1